MPKSFFITLSICLLLGFAIYGQQPEDSKDDRSVLIAAIQLLNAEVPNLCCSDSITRENSIAMVKAAFQALINDYPESTLKDDAQFFIAGVHYYNDIEKVRLEFQKLVDLYPNSTFDEITLGSHWFIGDNNGLINWFNTSYRMDIYAKGRIAVSYLDDTDDSNDFQMVSVYQELIDQYPDAPHAAEAQHMIGFYYNYIQDRYKAVTEYQKVINNYPNALFWKGRSWDHMGHMMLAVGDYPKIEEFAQQLALDYCTDNHISESYFSVEKNKRWPLGDPITVYMHRPDSSLLTPQDSLIVDSTLRIINTILPLNTQLELISEQSQGGNIYNGVDIELRFIENSANYAQIMGIHHIDQPFTEIARVFITINPNRPFHDQLRSTIHEFGHALGLGHSFSNQDLMFYSTTQVPAGQLLSHRDIKTIQLLYGNPVTEEFQACEGTEFVLPDGSSGQPHDYTTIPLPQNGLDQLVITRLSIINIPEQADMIAGETNVCRADTAVFYETDSVPNATSYLWTMPSGASGNSSTNSIAVNFSEDAVSGEISVQGINECGEGTAATLWVQVHTPPDPTSAISGHHSPAVGTAQTYAVTAVEGISYVWTVPPGSSIMQGQGSPVITIMIGTDSGAITVTPTNVCGTGSTTSLEIHPACGSNWTPLTNLQFNMQLVAQIKIDGQVSLNPNDVLVAFVGDECRGIASPDPLQDGIVFLTIGSNEGINEQVELKIWNSNTCSECNAIPGFAFVNQGEIGTFLEPYQVRCGAIQDITFGQGYTWFSLNVNPGSMSPASLYADLTPCYDDRVFGQTSFALYTGSAWVGSLTNLDMDKMYRMKLCSQQDLSLMGEVAPSNPIHLSAGYTWLGYTPQECLPINEALAHMTLPPTYDDRLIGQNAFALYTGSQWVGTLTTLCPGEGYVIRMANATTLNWPLAPPQAAFNAIPRTGAAPLVVYFADQSSYNPTNWLWDFGDGTVSTDQHPVHTYQNTGSYTVQLTVTNAAGVSDAEIKVDFITIPESSLYPVGTVHCSDISTAVVDVMNPVTGKTWMDRNLGASQAATSSTDELAYGDLYQWGRFPDGHQCRNSETTATLSSSDTPNHADFIVAPDYPHDWRSPSNDNLWQGMNGINNPCPIGYRLPTETELNEERLSWSSTNATGAYESPLKFTLAGSRNCNDGLQYHVGAFAYYWSANVVQFQTRTLFFHNSYAYTDSYYLANGHSIRCIKE